MNTPKNPQDYLSSDMRRLEHYRESAITVLREAEEHLAVKRAEVRLAEERFYQARGALSAIQEVINAQIIQRMEAAKESGTKPDATAAQAKQPLAS